MNPSEAPPSLPRRRKRRYFWLILPGIFLVWVIAIQSGCMAMRTPDREWPAKLRQQGQALPPVFADVPMPGYRSIHAVEISPADTSLPVVVMVHGSPGSADAYLSYLGDTALSRVARLITLDRPGFGYTTGFGRPEGSLERQAAAVHAVAQRLAPGKKVLLVGHSMGGPVITRYAMDYPGETAGLVIVAGSVDPDLEEHPWWQTAVDVPPLSWLTPKSLWASNREIKLLEAELRKMMPHWENIRCPVTVVHAEDDQLVPYGNMAFTHKMLVNCPDYREISLQKGDHFILWSRQDLVRQAIQNMLQRQLTAHQ